MTKDDLQLLKKLITSAKVHSCLTTDELNRLEAAVDVQLYVKQVLAFRDYLGDLMSMLDEEKTAIEFYKMPITIAFGDKSVNLENSAYVYQSVVDIIDGYIREDL